MLLLAALLSAASADPEVCRYPAPEGYDPGPEVAPCDDLAAMQDKAALGQLWAAQETCLEARLARETDPAARRAVSLLLIQNADARGDKQVWMRLTLRHLEEIDAEDGRLCLKYAVALSRGGVSKAEATIRWADAALVHAEQWTDDHDAQVYTVGGLRANAAHKLWQEVEKTLAEGGRDALVDPSEARARAADFARQWFELAQATGRDPKSARALCRAAGGGCPPAEP